MQDTPGNMQLLCFRRLLTSYLSQRLAWFIYSIPLQL
jgi:hypothetical protein